MSTLYCSFDNAESARQMASAVLEGGVLPDDISILFHEATADADKSVHRIGGAPAITDATDFVGAADDPDDGPSVSMTERVLPEDYTSESEIGAGISTSEPDDLISTVDESDDSQELAEDQSYAHPTQGVHEESDLQRALVTGFPTDIPRIEDFQSPRSQSSDLEKSLEALVVPGFGVVMGGGELSTAALAIGENVDMEPIRSHLKDQGVKSRTASEIIADYEGGAALMAISLSHGMEQASALEDLAWKTGAKWVETISAPRF